MHTSLWLVCLLWEQKVVLYYTYISIKTILLAHWVDSATDYLIKVTWSDLPGGEIMWLAHWALLYSRGWVRGWPRQGNVSPILPPLDQLIVRQEKWVPRAFELNTYSCYRPSFSHRNSPPIQKLSSFQCVILFSYPLSFIYLMLSSFLHHV